MAQVPRGKRGHLVFHAGFGGLGFLVLLGSRFGPLFDWLSAVRLVSFVGEPNPLKPA